MTDDAILLPVGLVFTEVIICSLWGRGSIASDQKK